MGKHAKPGPASEDRPGFHVELQQAPVYECQHTGRTVAAGRIVCSGCPKDYGAAPNTRETDYEGL